MKIEIEVSEKEFQIIENVFKIIKNNGSSYESKEIMCKNLLMKEVLPFEILTKLQGNGDFNIDNEICFRNN